MPRVLRNFVLPALFLGVQLAELLHVFVTKKPESYQKNEPNAGSQQTSRCAARAHAQPDRQPTAGQPGVLGCRACCGSDEGCPWIWGQVLKSHRRGEWAASTKVGRRDQEQKLAWAG